MSKTNFTKMQQAAIDIRDKNILVSAAAGSGKTAVLVQRIIDRVLNDENPIDIDRILVMTFTRAAAQQMKERILNAINEKKLENPHDKNLNKQYALVHNAYIMTIDSFCMNVVRNHFEEIDLNPDFRMADEGEITLLQKDVLEEVLEESYEEADEEFLEMTEIFASKKTDIAIEELVLSLHGFAESYPDPIKWLEGCVASFGNDMENELQYPWIKLYVNYIASELSYNRAILDEAGDLCNRPLGPRAYLAAIEDDICRVDNLLSINTYEELFAKCVEVSENPFTKLGRVVMPKGDDVTEDEILERTRLKERVSEIRDKYKKSYSEIVELISSMSPDVIRRGMDMMSVPSKQLVKLVISFSNRFNQKKRDMNIVDFSDIEHMCLEILRKGKDTIAKQYQDFFKEIYVDEYQDSNFVQEEILNLIAKTGEEGNVFMVGDVKQSIYGFRNAKPEIFIDKYDRFHVYSDGDEIGSRDVRIDLSHNFRSRLNVLDAVNSLFSKIMNREFGGIEYDEAAKLHKGRDFVDSGCDYDTELNLFISNEDVPDREAEALMVANKIKHLMSTLKVEDADSVDGTRPLRYSDIVILLRTAKGWDNVFMSVLESQGIPVFVTSSTGYFEALEVKTLLNFLKIIDNPLQDIPFAAVMMSIIGNFYEEEVAKIRAEFKDGYLYEAFEKYYEMHCDDESHEDSVLAFKVKKLHYLIISYRRKSEYLAVSDIITEIIDGDYGKLTKAMPGGQKKFANLNMLLQKAIEYGKTSYKGIFQFNRYIEAIRKYEIDYGEANISDENDNTVRIMSIHKSKGLEFPVCFVSGMNKKFNMMDTRNTVLTDGEYGLATDVIDIKRRIKSKSLFKITIAKKKQAEIIAEELRLLYVAMTRAKEKLILTGVIKEEESFRNALVTIEKAGSYLDMYSCAASNGELDNIRLSFLTAEDLVDNLLEETVTEDIKRTELVQLINMEKRIEGNFDEVKQRLSYKYPYEDKGFVKMSVSQLKHASERIIDEEALEFVDTTVYRYDEEKFIEDEERLRGIKETELVNSDSSGSSSKRNKSVGGTKHGSAVHRIFEIWDYNREVSNASISEFLAYVREEMLMEEDLVDLVSVEEIYDFLSSDIAKRMADAYKRGELFREQPFVMSDDENDPESMLIQGIIDAYFYEDGEIVLVDYKTDKVKSGESLKRKYSTQLVYYGKALKRMLHKNIRESVIYSTVLNETICI